MDFVINNGTRRHVMSLTGSDISQVIAAIQTHGSDEIVHEAEEIHGGPFTDPGEYVRYYAMCHTLKYGRPFTY